MNTKPFILVDGSSYLYRAFYALPPLTNSKGEPTGAIYGVVNMLRKLIKDYQPDHIAVVFDAKGKTFRDDLFAQYKAQRAPMPNDLSRQIAPLHEIVRAMGLPLLMHEGVEADDVIGTLALQAKAQGLTTLISTGDKDMAQLVDGDITLINTMSNTLLTPESTVEKFGVPPELIGDYLALTGDASDNVPGVPKVGPKTAVKWLQEYGSLNAVVENAHNITGKVGESLRENLEQLRLSRELVKIKTDVVLEQKPTDLVASAADNETLNKLFRQFEFKTWLAELLNAPSARVDSKDFETIFTQAALDKWLKLLQEAEVFAFDTETTSLNVLDAEIVGISFATAHGKAAYVPLAHRYLGAPEQLDRDQVLAQFKPLLEDANKAKIGQHLKFDINVLANYGIKWNGPSYDTMLESYVLNSSSNRHDMDSLALKYLGKKAISFQDIAGKGANMLCFDQIAIETAAEYAAEDADITLQLHQTLWPQCQENSGLEYIFNKIEIPLVPVLAKIERHGVLIDANKLQIQSGELGERIQQLQQQAFTLAGEVFNLGSPKQLTTILYEKLKLPITQKTPKGQPSTAENVLQELAYDYELPKVILEYRSLSKLKSTYADALPAQIHARTGRVHTSYNQAVVATGRLSSTDPNLQNIPIRTAEGRRIRQAFIAPPGWKIVAADYSQIELRIMAHLSEDPGLLTAFSEGLDIHKATAAEMFGIALDQVTSEQRRSAKAINFGLIYGMSAYGLARQLDIEPGLAKFYMERYFQRYPGVKTYMEATRKLAHEVGYVETLFGRRLYLPEINASKMQLQRMAERAAINAPMQGTAADIIKIAMIKMDHFLQTSNIEAHMIMQVHDELVFEVAADKVELLLENINECMSTAASLKVPLVVDMGVGDNWDEAH